MDIQKIQVNPKDSIIFSFDVEMFDVDEIQQIYNNVNKLFPNNKVVGIPKKELQQMQLRKNIWQRYLFYEILFIL